MDGSELNAEIDAKEGTVTVEGEHVGHIKGLVFSPDPSIMDSSVRPVFTAARRAMVKEVENRVQQLAARAAQIDEYRDRIREHPGASGRETPDRPNWHMVGSLQRNKVRKAIENEMNAVISLSRWKSSWYFCAFGSFASANDPTGA